MKRIVWAGSLVIAVAAAGIWANAQAGDYVWIETSGYGGDYPVLTDQQKNYLGIQINAAWGISGAVLDSLECWRTADGDAPHWTCTACAETSVTDEQYFALRKAGKVRAGDATVVRRHPGLVIPVELEDEFSALTTSVFGRSLSDLYLARFWRDAETPTIVYGEHQAYVVGSAALHRERDVAGAVIIRVGTVE